MKLTNIYFKGLKVLKKLPEIFTIIFNTPDVVVMLQEVSPGAVDEGTWSEGQSGKPTASVPLPRSRHCCTG
jgi:hypothetical protein